MFDDKEDLSLRAPHETLEEAQKDAGVQGTIVDHEPELAAVRQARNHALREARSRTSDDRRLASRREAAAIVGLVRKPGLIGPLDLGFLGLCPLGERWIARLQPLFDVGLAPLGCPLHRALCREAPALQIDADRLPRQPNARLALDQLGHSLARPQRERELQLIGTFVGDATADARGVPVLQRQLLAGAATALASVERPVAAFITRLHPFADEAPVDTDRSGRFLPGLAAIDQRYRAPSKFGLYRRFQLAEIPIPRHAEEVA